MAVLRKSVVWLLIGTQLLMPGLARAQIQKPSFPITVDKSGNSKPSVVSVSGNGVPVVHIAAPSNGGVSNNRYTQFNVGPSGVILNNSGTSSQTQLGGSIGGNALLGRTPAKVILNQVTAANPSQLLGALEVAGGRANVIVANPAGITCNGCGFLNANRATLTTGRPLMGDDGSLRGFDVTGGAITFNGQGLNGTNLSRVDIWARSLALNAQVWADHMDIVAGAASVDYLSGNATENNNPGPAPAFALDVAALGGMYANSIRLVGTEAGLGVNVGGNVAAANRLELTAQGDVRIAPTAHVQVAGPMSLQTAGTLVNSGAITAEGGLIARGQKLKNSGTITADKAKKNTAGMQLLFAYQRHAGTLSSGGDITVDADRLSVDSGLISAKGALTLTTSGLMKHGNAEIHGHTVAVRASALHSANGKIESDTDLRLNVDGLMRNQGSTFKAKHDVTLVAGNWVNTGLVQADQHLNLRSDHADNRQTGQIIGGTKTSLHSNALTNAGLIQAAKDLSIRSKRLDMPQTGRIVAGAQSDLHTDMLDNAGLIQAGQDLNLRGDRSDNQHTGQIVAGAKADFHSKVLHNAGLIDSGMTRLEAGEIVNTGEIHGDAIAIPANSLRNSRQGAVAGVIVARGDLDLGVASLVNQDDARILVGGALRLGGQVGCSGPR